MCAPFVAVKKLSFIPWWKDALRPFVVYSILALSLDMLTRHILAGNLRQQHALEEILQGHWTLVDLQVPDDALDHPNRYTAKAWFCDIDWDLHRDNPSSVSFLSGLKKQSKSCNSTLQSLDLFDLVQKIRAHDMVQANNMRSIPLTGVVFHESRCGSTLAANLLASFDPYKTRVYSEPSVTVNSIKACSASPAGTSCNHELHTQLIRDVHYILGRTRQDSSLEYVFVKSNSGGLYIDKFTSALPDTPWIYMFRDTHEIMQSHWKVPEEHLDMEGPSVKCARLHRNPNQPPTTLQVLKNAGNLSHHELTRTEYCAAHLASISNAVMQEHQRTGKGRFIDYKQMPAVMWETVLPVDFGVTIEPYMVGNMMQHSHVYSKGHQQGRANEQWASDTETKKESLSLTVKDAVETFCPRTYEQLEKISLRQQQSAKMRRGLSF